MRREVRNGRLCAVIAIVLLVVVASISLAGCAGSSGGAGGTWTVALYLCGSNLESKQGWATKTLEEIAGANMPAHVRVVVQAGGAKKGKNDSVTTSGTRREVKGGELVEVGQAGEDSMGKASTLADFLKFVEQEYPADHTAVVLWDHGGGPLKGACFDEEDGFDALTLPELDEAFSQGVGTRGGKPYDLVGFDACLMGSLETAAMLQDDASWLVASEELEAGAGWSYLELLEALGKGADAREAGVALCDGYQAKSAKRKKDATATLAVIDLSKIGAVEDAFNVLLDALRAEYGGTRAVRRVAYGVRIAESFGGASKEEGHTNLTDILDGMLPRPPYEKQQADFKTAIQDAVAYSVCGSATSGAHGLSLWYPIASSADEVAEYVGLSPLKEYGKALSEDFAEDPMPIKFLDEVKVNEKGGVTMTIDPACADAFYDLYVENRRTDGTYYDTNVDFSDDWDNLAFTYTPRNQWP